jgi:hypothetical protein
VTLHQGVLTDVTNLGLRTKEREPEFEHIFSTERADRSYLLKEWQGTQPSMPSTSGFSQLCKVRLSQIRDSTCKSSDSFVAWTSRLPLVCLPELHTAINVVDIAT